MTRHHTRESWLADAISGLHVHVFALHATTWPDKVRVACGWPRGRHGANRAIGQCWSTKASKDGANELFVSPELDEPTRVLDVLAHELVHAVVGTEAGHKGPFRALATAIGLEGKMTATTAGPALLSRLHVLASMLGPYPHAMLSPSAGGLKKQTTRMLKVTCADCGCIVRMTRQWLDDAGAPVCACGGQMAEA